MENNFSKNFKYLRLQNGYTQKKIAEKLNKDYSTIGKWELGQRSPIMIDVIKISVFFNIDIAELIGGKLWESNTNNKVLKSDIDEVKNIIQNSNEFTDEGKKSLTGMIDYFHSIANKEDKKG